MRLGVEKQLEKMILERQYLKMGVSGQIVWTLQLHDPSHREEQETGIPLSMDWESQISKSHRLEI